MAKSLLDILEDFGFKTVDDLKKSLIDKGVTKGGGQESNLAGSLRFNTVILGDDYVFTLSMNDYWKFVEDGRNIGKQPPIKVIEEWITAKGIPVKKAGRNTKKKAKRLTNKQVRKAFTQYSFEKRRKSLAFLIARKIGEKGTIKRFEYNGANFYKPVIDKNTQQLKKDIKEFSKKEIVIELKK